MDNDSALSDTSEERKDKSTRDANVSTRITLSFLGLYCLNGNLCHFLLLTASSST